MPPRFVALPDVPAGPAGGQVYIRCPACGESAAAVELNRRAMVCPWCDHHLPLAAGAHARLLLDKGSFQPLEGAPAGAALLGQARMAGRTLFLAVSDPVDGGAGPEPQSLLALVEVARREQHPLLWVASAPQGDDPAAWPGLQAGLQALHEAGVPWLVLLCGPCHGALAALALQADLVLAEPGVVLDPIHPAAGRRAGRLPAGQARRPRDLLRAGWADAILPRSEQRAVLSLLLDLLDSRARRPVRAGAPRRLRLPEPPGPVETIATGLFELHGDRRGEDDAALVGGLARLHDGERPVMVLATARGRTDISRHAGAIGAAGWRKAARLLRLAAHLELPVVVLVQQAGLRASRRDPPGELATALGEAMAALLSVPVPTTAVLLGDVGGLAGQVLRTADCVLALADVGAVLSPESAPDATLAREKDLPAALSEHLEELTQTYTVHGPLGRRKLLERRRARWNRRSFSGEALPPTPDSGEQG